MNDTKDIEKSKGRKNFFTTSNDLTEEFQGLFKIFLRDRESIKISSEFDPSIVNIDSPTTLSHRRKSENSILKSTNVPEKSENEPVKVSKILRELQKQNIKKAGKKDKICIKKITTTRNIMTSTLSSTINTPSSLPDEIFEIPKKSPPISKYMIIPNTRVSMACTPDDI